LAGGSNLYGYGAGDPVNNSDPFGLCPPEDRNLEDCESVAYWKDRASQSGMLGKIGNSVMAGFARLGESLIAEAQGYPVGGCGTEYACGLAPNVGPPALSGVKAALKQVHQKVGKLPKGKPGKFGSPQRGDSQQGYRLDPGHSDRPPGHPEAGPHINWWNWLKGKRGQGGESGAVPIPPEG
jgi:hypothetical protein